MKEGLKFKNFPKFFLLFFILSQGFSVFGICPPYIIPEIPSPTDYNNIVYINPTAPNGGNGTIASPYNTINGLRVNNALPSNTAYLIKRGTQLNERIYAVINNSYIGAYGEGEKPILYGGVRIRSGSQYVTINDLNIRAVCPSHGGNSAIILGEDENVSHITIANSYLTGVYDASKIYKYPYRAVKGKNNNWTIFNNVISYVYDDAVGMGSGDNIIIVRNYIHHMDMKRVGNEYTDTQPGALSDGSEFSTNCGDGIHLRLHNNVYIAGNLVDRSHTSWKFALIFKTPWTSTRKGAVIEHNTFIGNNAGPGGGTVAYFEGPQESTIRKNVFDATKYGQQVGPSVIYDVSGNGGNIANQTYPFGIYDNHLIRGNSSRNFYSPSAAMPIIEQNNGLFTGYSQYLTFLTQNPDIGLYGSDIDPDNFWVSFNCDGNSYNVDFDILNQEGIPVTNATITFAGITNPQGIYSFENIAEGTYSYTVQAQGFQTLNQGGLEINSDLTEIVNLQPSIHQVSLITTPVGSGITSGAGSYSYGQTANITASAKEGNTFINWSENGNVVSNNASYSFTVTQNRSLTANFSAESYSIALSASPTAGGTTTGAGTYSNGQSATVSATASTGYTFSNWTENGNVVSNNASYTFTVSQNRNLTANFSAITHTIALSASPTNGGTTAGGGTFNHGHSVTLTATAAAGYTFTNWTENGNVVSNNASYTFNVSQNHNLTANFSTNAYTIALNANPANGGTTTGGGTFSQGQNATVTATAADGFTFTNWTENGNVVSNNASYTFNVTQNRNLTANFSINAYTIALNANPANGGTTAGGGTFNQGQNATVTATAAPGYTFTNWTENGNVVSNNASYTFSVSQNRSLTANYTANSYTVELNVGPAGGGTTAGGGNFSHGQSVTVTATPEQGFVFISWIENGNLISSQASYSFTITQNRTLTANFGREMFILTYLTDSNGEIVGNPEQEVYYSENGEPVHALPHEGHHFVRWCDQLSFNPRTELFVTQNITRTAIFAKNVYHLSYGADNNGIILGETDQFIEYGDNALPVEALPLSGYRFIGWSDGTYDNPRTDLEINSDLQVFAIFDIEMEIEEPSINDILVYPIPTRNVLNVEIPFAGEFEVHLFDMQGRHINTLPNATQGSQNYNLSWLSPGVYYLNFLSPTGTLTRRIVKGR